jgi:WD40 repeat protein
VVFGVCAVRVGGRELLATAGDDRTVRLWDPATGAAVQVVHGHTGPVLGVCAVRVGGRELLASASDDRTVRLWNPDVTAAVLVIPTSGTPTAVTPFGRGSLFIGLDVGVLAVQINPAAGASPAEQPRTWPRRHPEPGMGRRWDGRHSSP